jgi:hypothetical protein
MSALEKKESRKPAQYDPYDAVAAATRISGLTVAGAAIGGIPGAAVGAIVGGGYELYRYCTTEQDE